MLKSGTGRATARIRERADRKRGARNFMMTEVLEFGMKQSASLFGNGVTAR